MKKKLFLCYLVFVSGVTAISAQTIEPTGEEMNVFFEHADEIIQKSDDACNEIIVSLSMNYMIPDSLTSIIRNYIELREKRKSICDYLYHNSLEQRVKAKMVIDSLFQDSIDVILIPYNSISGENISYALKIHKILQLDKAQKDYIEHEALDIARKIRRNPRLDVWDREMELLKNTLTSNQLNQFFVHKHGVKVGQILTEAWNRLEQQGLTTELDSVKDRTMAYYYYLEQLKIEDVYRRKDDLRRKALRELNKQKPLMVKMLDAIDKRKQVNAHMRERGNDFVW